MSARLVFTMTLIALLAAGLTGCFASGTQLIGARDADYPFTTITYAPAGEDDDKITLTRAGDVYVNPDEDKNISVRLKSLGGNSFVVQITEVKDGEPSHIYGVIELAADKTSFQLIKGVAEDHDLAAARAGEAGLTICPQDDGMVCIASLKSLADYAAQPDPADEVKRFNIFKLE